MSTQIEVMTNNTYVNTEVIIQCLWVQKMKTLLVEVRVCGEYEEEMRNP